MLFIRGDKICRMVDSTKSCLIAKSCHYHFIRMMTSEEKEEDKSYGKHYFFSLKMIVMCCGW